MSEVGIGPAGDSGDSGAYETVRTVLPNASVLLQSNPGPMTLDGTNTWLLRGAGTTQTVVVDPGEDTDTHLQALLAAATDPVLTLVTHRHDDHVGLADRFHDMTGVPVRAVDPSLCRGADPLADGEVLDVAGLRIRVLTTPGHTSDSASFVLAAADVDSVGEEAVLTGDSVLGRGTAVVAHPDGALGPYLTSLVRLRDLGHLTVLPGHGPELTSIADVASSYLAHRADRLDQVRDALIRLGADATAQQIVELVYAEVDKSVWWAAELSVSAQLAYLRDD